MRPVEVLVLSLDATLHMTLAMKHRTKVPYQTRLPNANPLSRVR